MRKYFIGQNYEVKRKQESENEKTDGYASDYSFHDRPNTPPGENVSR